MTQGPMVREAACLEAPGAVVTSALCILVFI